MSNDRSTRNNVYDLIHTSAYVFGICILVVIAFAIGKGICIIIKY